MISRFEAYEYRVLGGVSCDLGPFTLVVGPNGCGKSTVLEVLEFARFRGDGDIGSGFSPVGARVRLVVEPKSATGRWTRSLDIVQDGTLRARWLATLQSNVTDEVAVGDGAFPATVVRPRFDLARLRAPTHVSQQSAVLLPDGMGLAGLLADWKLEDDPRFGIVEAQLGDVVPNVRAIKPYRRGGEYAFALRVGPREAEVPAHQVSDGTLYALALLTLLQSMRAGMTLLLMDDLDQELHPRAQEALVTALRGVLRQRQDLQIVATCHSPYLVDQFSADDVRIMAPGQDGLARMRRLSEHPDFVQWKDQMRTGEFWSSVGEDWVSAAFPGGPVP